MKLTTNYELLATSIEDATVSISPEKGTYTVTVDVTEGDNYNEV